MAYLLASKQIFFEPEGKIFLGELALDGKIRPIKGVLSLAKNAKSAGFKEIFLPKANAKEAALIDGIKIFACEKLEDITNHFDKENTAGFGKNSRKRKLILIISKAKFYLIFPTSKGKKRPKGVGDCCRRRSQCDDVRSGRHRQDDAG